MSLAGVSVLVIGLGVSGNAAAEALLGAGASVRVVEPGRAPAIDERAGRLAAAGADVRRDETDPHVLLEGRALVVPSPIVPPHAPVLRAARARGVEIISEPELGWRLAGGRTRVVGVTGTNGKTTTTELLAACLSAPAAGNIGMPLTAILAAPEPPPLVVAELSSFQLNYSFTLAPEVAVVLNLAPDHLDWHGSFVAYAAAKSRIWRVQGPQGVAITNGDDAEAFGLFEAHPPPGRAATFAPVADGRIWSGDVPVVAVSDLALTGPHWLANVRAVVAAAVAAGANPAGLAEPLRAFRPGRHRQERVAVRDGVTFVDDSKATNPHAAAAALACYPSIVWIAGGLNKGLSFDGLAPLLPGRVRAVVTIGSSGPALAEVARSAGVRAVEAGVMAEAVPAAAALAQPGDTVLLAPACASMDQFTDYADRGRAFADAVHQLSGAAAEAIRS
jgi:UDP-N-acetylmuramoylalanine--D-glutamate ligase